MASVLSQASGRSAKRVRISAAPLNQCSGLRRRRLVSARMRPSAMQSSASCASNMPGSAKWQSLVATSGRPRRSARATCAALMRSSSGRRWRWSSTASRSPNASLSVAARRSASASCPSPRSRASGPLAPPVSRISPSAWSKRRERGICGGRGGSASRKPREERICRLRSPAASWARATMGSGGRSGLSGRARESWQPMIGWIPALAQVWENSRAPKRLLVSVIATAGIFALRASSAIFATLIAPSLSE